MLRDNLADSFYPYLENPRPTRPDPSLTEYVISPFQAEPAQHGFRLQLRTQFIMISFQSSFERQYSQCRNGLSISSHSTKRLRS
jgi:hypothetical protein